MGEGMSSFLQGLGWNALEASALAVAVALMSCRSRSCRRRARAAARHLLWLLVLVKLLLPPVLVDPLGLGNACARAAEWLRARPEPGPEGPEAGAGEEFPAEVAEE